MTPKPDDPKAGGDAERVWRPAYVLGPGEACIVRSGELTHPGVEVWFELPLLSAWLLGLNDATLATLGLQRAAGAGEKRKALFNCERCGVPVHHPESDRFLCHDCAPPLPAAVAQGAEEHQFAVGGSEVWEPDVRSFWGHVEKSADEVSQWPEAKKWKPAGESRGTGRTQGETPEQCRYKVCPVHPDNWPQCVLYDDHTGEHQTQPAGAPEPASNSGAAVAREQSDDSGTKGPPLPEHEPPKVEPAGAVCGWRSRLPDDDDEFKSGPVCGKPAVYRGCDDGWTAHLCEEHKCRCSKPLRKPEPSKQLGRARKLWTGLGSLMLPEPGSAVILIEDALNLEHNLGWQAANSASVEAHRGDVIDGQALEIQSLRSRLASSEAKCEEVEAHRDKILRNTSQLALEWAEERGNYRARIADIEAIAESRLEHLRKGGRENGELSARIAELETQLATERAECDQRFIGERDYWQRQIQAHIEVIDRVRGLPAKWDLEAARLGIDGGIRAGKRGCASDLRAALGTGETATEEEGKEKRDG